jgi:transposase
MRKSFNGLYALVAGTLEADPLSGHLFVFCNRRRDRIKILCFDGSGLWICAKRLEKGTFHWPAQVGGAVELTQAQLNLLLGGLDLKQTRRRRWLR